MTEVLVDREGDEDLLRPGRLRLRRRERLVATVAAAVLALGVLTAQRGLDGGSTLEVAADGLLQVRPDGRHVAVEVPAGTVPARLLRLPGATVLLVRPPMRADGGTALLLPDGASSLRRLGPADEVVPDSRGDRVWLVRGGATKSLVAYDGHGRRRAVRQARTPHDLLAVTPEGVLDDEVVHPGGSTPTLRADDGTVLRRLPGPVAVLDVRAGRLLVLQGSCLDDCRVAVWDLHGHTSGSAPLDSGLLVLGGALSDDGEVALVARSARDDSRDGAAVLLRGRPDGGEPTAVPVRGSCDLLACRVAWSGRTLYASVDREPGRFVRWLVGRDPAPFPLVVPDVVDLAGR